MLHIRARHLLQSPPCPGIPILGTKMLWKLQNWKRMPLTSGGRASGFMKAKMKRNWKLEENVGRDALKNSCVGLHSLGQGIEDEGKFHHDILVRLGLLSSPESGFD